MSKGLDMNSIPWRWPLTEVRCSLHRAQAGEHLALRLAAGGPELVVGLGAVAVASAAARASGT
jgi:hypothetical protein